MEIYETGKNQLVRQSKTGASNMIERVNEARKLPRIKDETRENITQVLRYVFVLLGFRGDNLPDRNESAVFMDYFLDGNLNYSLMDIKNAFVLYVKGKLDYSTSHFQHFSIMFLESVMQSYSRYRNLLPVSNSLQLETETELTETEINRLVKNGCIDAFDLFKKTGNYVDYANVTFNYLDKAGLIQYSDDERKEFYQQAKNDILSEAGKKKMLQTHLSSDLNKLIKEVIGGCSETVISRAKKYMLWDYFNNLIDEGKELSELLNHKL